MLVVGWQALASHATDSPPASSFLLYIPENVMNMSGMEKEKRLPAGFRLP